MMNIMNITKIGLTAQSTDKQNTQIISARGRRLPVRALMFRVGFAGKKSAVYAGFSVWKGGFSAAAAPNELQAWA